MDFTVEIYVHGKFVERFPAPWRDTDEVKAAIDEAGFLISDDPPPLGFRVKFSQPIPGRGGPPAYYYLPSAARTSELKMALRRLGVRL